MSGFFTKTRSYSAVVVLLLLIAVVYLPFMGKRFVRTAGDEKVYVSQVIEMERDGRWFVQTLQDVPDYYKGPLHPILTRAGIIIFGKTPWAILYMNLVMVVLGSLAVFSVIRRNLPGADWTGVWAGFFFATGVGIYTHAYISQMDVELAGLFAIAMFLLSRLPMERDGFVFWMVVGLTGLVKAPLHSFLLGISAFLFWLLTGELLNRLINPKTWLAIGTGVAICLLGFAPAYFFDHANFVALYIMKEIVNKTATHQHWSIPVVPIFSYYLLPWALLAIVAYLKLPFLLREVFLNTNKRRLFFLSISFLLPSVVFFIMHPYRLENYNLPAIGAVVVLVTLLLHAPGTMQTSIIRVSLFCTSLICLLFATAVSAVAIRFWPLPEWWPQWLLTFIWLGSLFSALGFFFFGAAARVFRPLALAISSVGIIAAIAVLGTTIGERELIDLRGYLAQKGNRHSLGYYNLQRNIWSEWGILNFWVKADVYGIHDENKLRQVISRGGTVLVPSKEALSVIQAAFPGRSFNLQIWKKWRTQGKSDDGHPLWLEAWRMRNLAVLERDFYILNP
ncbi:MAG: glycosyltransferase family 39 protein [Bdellovibrionota bacterium]